MPPYNFIEICIAPYGKANTRHLVTRQKYDKQQADHVLAMFKGIPEAHVEHLPNNGFQITWYSDIFKLLYKVTYLGEKI